MSRTFLNWQRQPRIANWRGGWHWACWCDNNLRFASTAIIQFIKIQNSSSSGRDALYCVVNTTQLTPVLLGGKLGPDGGREKLLQTSFNLDPLDTWTVEWTPLCSSIYAKYILAPTVKWAGLTSSASWFYYLLWLMHCDQTKSICVVYVQANQSSSVNVFFLSLEINP